MAERKKRKEAVDVLRLQVPAGQATPGQPIGPALGQRGINIMEFVQRFNEETKAMEPGLTLPVVITSYKDRSFDFIVRTPPAAVLLCRAAGIAKGSKTPNTEKVAKITRDQAEEIARTKQPDLTAADMDAAIRTVAGTAASMGIDVEGVK